MKRLSIVLFIATTFIISCSSCNNEKPDAPAVKDIPQLSYTVVAVHPHDENAFTEGLEWYNGFLYEGTGDTEYSGKSKLSKTDFTKGTDLQKIYLAKEYFGEGITILKDKIYQLTYKEQKCFVYDAATFKKIQEFTYQGEGWGLTNDGTNLIMSNGTSDVVYRNPETFEVIKTITVSNNYGPLSNVNELEYVNGFIYANVWTTRKIIKIDIATGKVVAEANFDDVIRKYAPDVNEKGLDVLNGIAYDSTQQRFFITGKYWPVLFEVKFQ